MKSVVLVVLVAIFVVVAKKVIQPPQYDLDEAPKLFQKFIVEYKKRYKNNQDAQAHFEAFKENLKQLNKQNLERFPAEFFSINQFSDFTGAEKSIYPSIFSKTS